MHKHLSNVPPSTLSWELASAACIRVLLTQHTQEVGQSQYLCFIIVNLESDVDWEESYLIAREMSKEGCTGTGHWELYVRFA